MVVKVYFWKSAKSFSFGHISLELSDATYISWYPKEPVKYSQATKVHKAKYYETFDQEIAAHKMAPDETFYILEGRVDEGRIKIYFQDLLKRSMSYDLTDRSCCSVVYNALCEGSEWFKGRAKGIITPENLAELVKAFTKGENKRISSFFLCK